MARAMMINDERFMLPSPQAKAAFEAASSLLIWCKQPDNSLQATKFAMELILKLKSCFAKSSTSLQRRKEAMWGIFHQLRMSQAFLENWNQFLLQSIKIEAAPALIQFITSTIFKELIVSNMY